jgi:hypothetical protein
MASWYSPRLSSGTSNSVSSLSRSLSWTLRSALSMSETLGTLQPRTRATSACEYPASVRRRLSSLASHRRQTVGLDVRTGSLAELEVGGRTVRVSNPDRVYLPASGPDWQRCQSGPTSA